MVEGGRGREGVRQLSWLSGGVRRTTCGLRKLGRVYVWRLLCVIG